MNILHLTTFLQGGAGRILSDLALAQQKAGNNVWVLASRTNEPGYCSYSEYIKVLNKNEIPFIETDSSFKRDLFLNLKFSRIVRELICRYQIDIIHAHATIPALTGIIGRAGIEHYIPIIQTMHGWGRNKTPDQEEMDIQIMNGLDRVVTGSESDRNWLITKGVRSEIITRIYNGIDKDKIEDSEVLLKEELQVYRNNGKKIIGCIGTVCERKNQSMLVRVVNRLHSKYPIFCLIIGEGELIPSLQAYVNHENLGDYVKFYGYQPNAASLMKYFDFLVLPSTSEGFGLVIVEGFRAKVPVIASDIEVFQELIEDQVTGYLFHNNSEDSLENVLSDAIKTSENKNSKLVDRAYIKYKEQFTLERMINDYHDLYQKLTSVE